MCEVLNTKFGTAKLDNKGYYLITTRKEGYHGKALHRLLFEDFYNISLPPNIDIHHLDGDKLNNNIWNLIPLTRSEHMTLHRIDEMNKGVSKTPNILTKIKISETQNSTGYFRVHSHKDSTCKQGFYYQYRWKENGKEKSLNSVDIDKLKEKVLKKGLEWIEYDKI